MRKLITTKVQHPDIPDLIGNLVKVGDCEFVIHANGKDTRVSSIFGVAIEYVEDGLRSGERTVGQSLAEFRDSIPDAAARAAKDILNDIRSAP